MIIKKTFISLILVSFLVELGLAHSYGSTNEIRWGESINGVRLSITMSNSLVDAGSLAFIATVITNGSANPIIIALGDPEMDYDLLLTNGGGMGYNLTPPFILGSSTRITINTNIQFPETIPVTFGTNIVPGDYTLQATRFFGLGDGRFKVDSNLLNVHVK
jgi:hypothetical protein